MSRIWIKRRLWKGLQRTSPAQRSPARQARSSAVASSRATLALCGLICSGGALAQAPAITPRGIVNAASLMPASLSGGKLAPGARIIIRGLRLTAPGSPTTVHLKTGDWTASITPVRESDVRIEADLPADLPSGEVQISVETSQGTSRAQTVASAHSSPGIFTLNDEGWGPVIREAVHRGQEVTIRVNGMNDANPKVKVGGVAARVKRVHGQDLTFAVPSRAPDGCWTPLWIESADGSASNFATLRIADRDGICHQPDGWPLNPVAAGQRAAIVIGARIQGSLEVRKGQPQEFTFDSAAAFLQRAGAGQTSPFQILPPAGTCTAYTGTFSLLTASVDPTASSAASLIDLGPALTIGDGRHSVNILSKGNGLYSAALGGTIPVMWAPGTPLFFAPGNYAVRSGDARFDVPLTVPSVFNWVNRGDVKEIDRSSGVFVRWAGVGADRQMLIAAFSVHPDTSAMGTTLCVAPPGATGMQIPPDALKNLPPTDRPTPVPIRGLILASIPRSSEAAKTSKEFDVVRSAFIGFQGQTVTFR